ncbi:MAG: hypothetical protein PHU21_13395, partial [Elusimicrobia bacterium]|nr:hypothetical protein [Elusimicrobiota bacterium]
MIENAVFISDGRRLDLAAKGCSRLYFGAEFCERLLPDAAQLDAARDFAQQRRLAFTFVTPFVAEAGLAALQPLLERLAAAAGGPFEVVVNDWGVFRQLTEGSWKGALVPVLGRLLTKQKRDPRIAELPGLPEPAREHLRRCSADAPAFAAFLRERGVARIELDNPLQGLERGSDLRASLYVPFVTVTTTRLCFMAGADSGPRELRRVAPCGRECRSYTATLRSRGMGRDLILKGNTQFYENPDLPKDLEVLGVDRLVRQ